MKRILTLAVAVALVVTLLSAVGISPRASVIVQADRSDGDDWQSGYSWVDDSWPGGFSWNGLTGSVD